MMFLLIGMDELMTEIEKTHQLLSQINFNFSKLQNIIDTARDIIVKHHEKLAILLTALLADLEKFFPRTLRLIPVTVMEGELLNAVIYSSKIYFLPIIREIKCNKDDIASPRSHSIYIPTVAGYRSDNAYNVIDIVRSRLKIIMLIEGDYYVLGLPPPEYIENSYPRESYNTEYWIAMKVNSIIASLNLLLNLREIVSFVREEKLLDIPTLNLDNLSMSLDVNLKIA